MMRGTVVRVSRNATKPFIIGIHYAARMPSISYAFGLFEGDKLEGVVTYGTPSSDPLRRGICGDDFKGDVLELNRLCLRRNRKNDASFLVAASLRMMPKEKIIVSFADTEYGHIGTVYQACNFVYCGLSAKRTNWRVRGLEHLHGQTIADKFRGVKNRSQAMRKKYGSDFYLEQRSRKHRYVITTGPKGFKRRVMRALKYDVLQYPKRAILQAEAAQ